MRAKSFGLLFAGILALVLVMGLGSAFNAEISAVNPTVVSSSFIPQLGSELVRGAEAFVGRTTNRTVNSPLGETTDTIFWKIIIDGPSTLTADMVDLDEVGFLDPPATVSHIETFHYPFSPDGSGNLVVVGSCDGNVTAVGHSNSCVHNIGFSLDANDVFHNADKIKFNSNAPLGTYVITYQLVHTTPDPDTFSEDNHQVTFILTTPITTPPEVTLECPATTDQTLLRVKGIDFQNNGMQHANFGEDDEWFPLEEVEVDIELENRGNFDASDIEVMWGIYDTQSNKWVVDLDKEDEINLDEGDEKTLTVTFKLDDDVDVDLDELSDGSNYRFYVVARGSVDDNNAPNNGADTCIADFEAASVVIESNFVVLDGFQVPESVSCGETVFITANVWNVGDNDQDEVKVDVYDKDRKLIDNVFEIGDIDALDNAELSLDFKVPRNAEEKTYTLILNVLDEDNDIYQNDFNDDDSTFNVPLVVSGGCAPKVTVTASTVSGGKAGQDLVVKVTATNTGDSQAAYSLNVAGSESWASSFSLDQTSLVLNAGESKDVTATFDVNRDASGSQTFSFDMVSGTGLVSQPVNVQIEKSSGLFGITGNSITENPVTLGLSVLVLILIVTIVVVAIRRR